MSKAKKKIATTFAKSKIGKNVITKTFGSTGEEYIKGIQKLLDKYYDKKESKHIVSNFYKLAVKIKMMVDSKKVDMERLKSYKKAVFRLSNTLLNLLSDSEPDDAVITALVADLKKANEFLHQSIDKNLTQKNIDIVDEVFQKVVNERIITALIKDAEYGDIKNKFKANLHDVLILNDKKYALSVNVKLPNDKFCAQYKKEIETCQTFWASTSEERERLAMSIFSRLVEANSDYYNIFQNCKYGSDPEKQYALLSECIGKVIEGLSDWEKLRGLLHKVGRSHSEWGPGLKIEVYDDLQAAFHKSMVKIFPAYRDEEVISHFTIIARLILRAMEEVY